MTAYFDSYTSAILSARGKLSVHDESFREMELQLVEDVLIASELPWFPNDLQVAIHRVVLEHAIHARPSYHPTAESDESFFANWLQLAWKLHSIFHELAQRWIMVDEAVLSDDPRCGVRILADRARRKIADLSSSY